MVSIPRCEIILTALQHQLIQSSEATHEVHACHGTSEPVDRHTKALTLHRNCECTLLKFMAFRVPDMNLHEYVVFRIQSEMLLNFIWQRAVTDFKPRVEPPYPKA